MPDGFQDTTTRRATRKKEGYNVNQEVPPQAPIYTLSKNVTNAEFRFVILEMFLCLECY